MYWCYMSSWLFSYDIILILWTSEVQWDLIKFENDWSVLQKFFSYKPLENLTKTLMKSVQSFSTYCQLKGNRNFYINMKKLHRLLIVFSLKNTKDVWIDSDTNEIIIIIIIFILYRLRFGWQQWNDSCHCFNCFLVFL